MLVVGSLLIAIGLVVALMGVKLFRLLLPVIGLVTGAMAGFIGMQAVFGTGAVGIALALVVALIVGVLLAILSFAFLDLAIVVYVAMLGAGAFAYLGVALGLEREGVLVFLMSVAGAIMTAVWASRGGISLHVVTALTSFVGVAYVLVGMFLLTGKLDFEDLNEQGVAGSIVRVVDQSFLWMLVWLGGSLLAWQVQLRALFDGLPTKLFV